MKRKRDEALEAAAAAEMKQSLAKEGLITLVVLHSNIDHKQFAHHFDIVEGLCNLLVETASRKTTASYMDKITVIRDLMSRLERQLMWIGIAQKIIMTEYPKLTKAYYADNLDGIVSSAKEVKIENHNQSKKCFAYLELVDMDVKSILPDSSTLDDWDCYLKQLRKDWEKKNILLFLKKNEAPELQKVRNDAEVLNQQGDISVKLLEDLVKCVEGEQLHAIIPRVLIDPSHSHIEYFYKQHFVLADYMFTLISEECMSDKHVGIKNEKLAELLKLLEEYTGRVCGSIISEEVIKMTQSFDAGDIDGLKSGLNQVKIRFQLLDKDVKGYFKLIDDIHRLNAIDCWIKLKLPAECGPAVSEVPEG